MDIDNNRRGFKRQRRREEEDIEEKKIKPDLVYTTHPHAKVSAKFQAHLKHYPEQQIEDCEEKDAGQLEEKSGEDGDDSLHTIAMEALQNTMVDEDYVNELLNGELVFDLPLNLEEDQIQIRHGKQREEKDGDENDGEDDAEQQEEKNGKEEDGLPKIAVKSVQNTMVEDHVNELRNGEI